MISAAISAQWRERLRAFAVEARGGAISAAVAAPLAIGFGMFAFVGLGDEFFGHGVIAGLYSALIAGVVCVLLGDRSGALFAPRIVTTFFIGTLLLQHVAGSEVAIVRDGGSAAVLAIVFAIVFAAGLLQLLFGACGVGTLIRFTPQPVIAGFQNCAALLLVLAQLGQVLGLPTHVALTDIPQHLFDAKPLSIAVAGVAAIATWQATRWAPRIPAVLFGLAAGTLVYYALLGMGSHSSVGPVIGSAPAVELIPINAALFFELARHPGVFEILPLVLSGAFSIAMIASVDALVCSRLIESASGTRTPVNVHLGRLGAANMAAACFGGITAGINLGPSAANRTFVGQGPVSVLVNAGLTLLLIVVAMPLVAAVPRAALSGVIVVIGIQHLDPWSIDLTRKVFARGATEARRPMFDLAVVVLVALAAIAVDIVFAVLLGVALAVVIFLARMSRSIVRRAYRANLARSRKMRAHDQRQYLAERGSVILVVELDGALFFGTAERLGDRIELELAQETRCVLLDCKRVAEIDTTGAGILRELRASLARRGVEMHLCGVLPDNALMRVLRDGGVVGGATGARTFVDVDRAIERAEDDLIEAELAQRERHGDYPLGAVALLRHMDLAELGHVRSMLARRRYAASQVVFKQGEPGEALFIVLSGAASARMIDDGRELRLMSFGPGSVFGEMGLLERSTRSATVVADEPLECLVLEARALDALSALHPSIAIKLIAALGRELAARLRLVNRTIVHLET